MIVSWMVCNNIYHFLPNDAIKPATFAMPCTADHTFDSVDGSSLLATSDSNFKK